MNAILFNSKEDIKNRMLRNALDFWGTSNLNDIDPFVKLLIEALSSELFNVSNDIKNLENRILNKVSRVLASDYLTSALPAHAILKGVPVEGSETLSINNHFFYRKPGNPDTAKNSGEPSDVFFTPVGQSLLFNAGIRYIFSGRHIYEHDELSHRTKIANALPEYTPTDNALWIGIHCATQVESLKNAAIFFEWPGYSMNEDFYKLLAVVKCYNDKDELQITPGLYYEEDNNKEIRPVFYEQNIINQITSDIKDYYNNRFISLSDDRLDSLIEFKQQFPQPFTGIFNPADLNRLHTCVWLKLTFPAAITTQTIDDLQVSINCIPVMNRRLYEQKFRLKNINNIIPVKPADREHFLSVKELKDDHNIYYNEIPYTQANQRVEGSYTIRNGGAERFDPRNAHQVIEYLFELLRDEKAAFAAYGNDFLNNILKTLEQNLALIEKKSLNVKSATELINYLVVKPQNKANMMYLQYWTTLADGANNIRRGSKLQQFESVKIKADSLRLVTTTIGGRNSLGASERIQAYKYGLTTKDRIVTPADLSSFCYYELGNKVEEVKITTGVSISSNPKEGLKKTTDIYIKPSKNIGLSADEWDTLLALLQSKLESRSIVNSTYRLFVA
jgi:hypothetical protein